MAKLDPTPDKEKSQDSECVVLILHGLSKNTLQGTKPVSIEDVQDLLKDRPAKFNERQVRYRDSEPGSGRECEHCWHMFSQVAGRNRKVCEILRPDDEQKGIDPEKVCTFFTLDGIEYPLSKENSSKSSDRQSSEG